MYLILILSVLSSAGSIPDFYDIYRYLNWVRYSIFDTFVVNLPKTYISLLLNRVSEWWQELKIPALDRFAKLIPMDFERRK